MFKSKRSRRLAADILTYIALCSLGIFCIGPMAWMFLTSLKPEADIVTSQMQYIPRHVTFENYVAIWTQSNFPVLITNSLIVTTITVAICVATGTLAAYAFARMVFRGRNSLMLGYLLIRMFPAVMMIIPLYVMMRTVGLVDSRFGLALAYTSFLLPLFVWMLKGFFDAAPKELESAARIDGSTRFGAMVRIVLPLARNGLVASSVFIAIAAWNEFIFALMLTTGQGSRTWPVGLQLMVGEFQLPWGVLAAGGILSILPVMLLFAIVQRAMVQGLTAGAVKG
ncbi:carbohydrate ABC transporter permease [Neorhizobium sp. Rsf11]|uniref:Carbohydrate ABC transporter permease n=2 Tax=Neorhizobium TaxID=1525371 RepID=A0ABV0MCP8_9HYPH|nr:carbohydrate ABC transporter permease [Neorhizobium petrolearium]MCC2613928.1 carbohydrate ABC transporter permease [Neorhizobium petrolearium]WGI71453.1 carbohydrate ABC transporter permease [Neorhizobium petrolearium]